MDALLTSTVYTKKIMTKMKNSYATLQPTNWSEDIDHLLHFSDHLIIILNFNNIIECNAIMYQSSKLIKVVF